MERSAAVSNDNRENVKLAHVAQEQAFGATNKGALANYDALPAEDAPSPAQASSVSACGFGLGGRCAKVLGGFCARDCWRFGERPASNKTLPRGFENKFQSNTYRKHALGPITGGVGTAWRHM